MYVDTSPFFIRAPQQKEEVIARPSQNAIAKRNRELLKKQKREEKAARKAQRKADKLEPELQDAVGTDEEFSDDDGAEVEEASDPSRDDSQA